MTRLLYRTALILVTAGTSAVTLGAHPLGHLTNQQLAHARAGTAAYHDVATAIADGYAPLGFNPEEGIFEFVNFSLIDCHIDPSHPEALAYVPSGNGLRLIGVEYVVPMDCTAPGTPPQAFGVDEDSWATEGDLPLWRLDAMIWAGRQQGPFDSGDDESGR